MSYDALNPIYSGSFASSGTVNGTSINLQTGTSNPTTNFGSPSRGWNAVINLTAASGTGTFNAFFQTAPDNSTWQTVSTEEINLTGNGIVYLKLWSVNQYIRLSYTTTGSLGGTVTAYWAAPTAADRP